MKDFRQLKVWEKAHQLALGIYKATGRFPREELYGLTSQTRRASMSIPTNIAEGRGRNTDADLLMILNFSQKINTGNSTTKLRKSNGCLPRF